MTRHCSKSIVGTSPLRAIFFFTYNVFENRPKFGSYDRPTRYTFKLVLYRKDKSQQPVTQTRTVSYPRDKSLKSASSYLNPPRDLCGTCPLVCTDLLKTQDACFFISLLAIQLTSAEGKQRKRQTQHRDNKSVIFIL